MIALAEIRKKALELSEAAFLEQVKTPMLLCEVAEALNAPTRFQTLAAQTEEVSPPAQALELPARVVIARAQLWPVAKSEHNPFSASIFVGRTKTNDLMLRHESVSKSHAFFQQDETGWTLTDNDSSNKTFLDGVPLAPNKPARLPLACNIVFGSYVSYFLAPAELFRFCRTVQDV